MNCIVLSNDELPLLMKAYSSEDALNVSSIGFISKPAQIMKVIGVKIRIPFPEASGTVSMTINVTTASY